MNASHLTPMGRRIQVGMASTGIKSLSELARQVGVSPQTVRRWLYDPRASVCAVSGYRLGEVLHLSSRWLITGESDPTPREVVKPNERKLLSGYRKLSEPSRSILLHCLADLIEID